MAMLKVGLFFRETDVETIRGRIHEPRYEKLWAGIRSVADQVAETGDVVLPGDTMSNWYYIRNHLMDLAMAAMVTGEEPYIQAVKKILRTVADSGMDYWQGPEYPNRPRTLVYHGETRLAGELETAAITMGVSTAYDWCYGYLDEDLRRDVIRALKEKGQMLLRNSVLFQSENWVMNHLCVLSSALTLSSLILRSEGEDTAEDLAMARRGLNLWMDKLEYDGSYGESYHYWAYPTNCLFLGLYAFYHVEGIMLENTHRIANAFQWALHNQVGKYEGVKGYDRPVAVAVNNYDCPFLFQMEAPEALLYAKLLKNPLANWYIDHFLLEDPPRPDCLHHAWHRCGSLLLALDDPQAPRISPAEQGMPLDRYFADTGFVYLRDSWDHAGDVGGDMVFSLQSGGGGRSCSHEHFDKNSFSLYAYGEYLITDPGHSCYRGESHQTYDTSTAAHNTVDIDGENQTLAFLERGMLHDEVHTYRSFHNQAQVVGRNFNPHCSYIASDAKRCYTPALKAFTRHVLFLRPDYFVIFDQIDTGDSRKARNGFNINNYDGETVFTQEAGKILAQRPNASLCVQYAFPQNVTFAQSPGRLHTAYHVLIDQQVEGKLGSAVKFAPQVDGGFLSQGDYLYVLCPKKPGEDDPVVELVHWETEDGASTVLRSFQLDVSFRGRKNSFQFRNGTLSLAGSGGEEYDF